MNAYYRLAALVVVNSALTLMSHAHATSADWQAKKAEFEQKFEAACGADADKFCPNVKGAHAVHKCMKANQASLSPSCTTFENEMKAKFKAHREAKEAQSASN